MMPTAWSTHSFDDETRVRFKYVFTSKFMNIAMLESDIKGRVSSTVKNGNMSFIIRVKHKANKAIAFQFKKKAGR